jgi:hypothetical protein
MTMVVFDNFECNVRNRMTVASCCTQDLLRTVLAARPMQGWLARLHARGQCGTRVTQRGASWTHSSLQCVAMKASEALSQIRDRVS